MTPTGSPPPADGIGSSESGAILGLSSFASQFDVWRAKVEGVHQGGDNPMMRWGRILEDVVAADFQERTGIRLVRILDGGRQRTLRMKGHPLITARLDRRTFRKPRKVVEVKTSPYGHGYAEAGELADGRAGDGSGVPPYVRVQVLHQLAVTGYEEGIVAVLIGGYQRRDYVIPRDEAVIADLVAELEDWWARYIVTKTPPPVDGSPGAMLYLRSRYPRDTEDVITATPEQALLVAQYRAAKAAQGTADKMLDVAKQRLIDAIGSHAGMAFPGGRATYKAHDVRTVNWEIVAGAYRTLVEELVRALGAYGLPPATLDEELPSPVRAALADLDVTESIHTLTRTDRPLRVTFEKEA